MPRQPASALVPTAAARLSWVDALRGYAILAVMAYHVSHELPMLPGFPGRALGFGSTGVQLFFMVSAFTIFLTLDEGRKQGRLSYRAFFIRRVMRILPLFWLALLVEAFFYRIPHGSFSGADFLATLTFASAWIPSLCPTMVPGGWSIAVEMWFYALAPLLFRFIRSLPHALLFALAAVVLRLFLNEGLARWIDPAPPLFPSFLFFWLPNQLPLFALGMVVFFLYRRREASVEDAPAPEDAVGETPGDKKGISLFFLLSGIYVLAAAVQGFKAMLPFHVLFGLGFLLVILRMMDKPDGWLANRPMAALGRISYSAYIAHFFVLRHTGPWLAARLEGMPLPPEARFALLMAWTLAATVAASVLLHRLVERPGLALGKKLAAVRAPH